MNIDKWSVPKELFDKYVKARIMADFYINGTGSNPSGTDYERSMRWLTCVKIVMKIHRKICEAAGVEYSEDVSDEFYKHLRIATEKETKLRG